MNLFDQILLKIFCLVVLLFSLVILLLGFGLFGTAYDYLDLIYRHEEPRLVLIVFAFFLMIVSLRFLLTDQRRRTLPQTINIRNPMGETRISLAAMENIASKVLQRISGISDWKVRLKPSETEGNQFFIKIVVDGDTPIPQIIERIQQEVKAAAEELTGLEIAKVSVLVSDVANTAPAKIRRVE